MSARLKNLLRSLSLACACLWPASATPQDTAVDLALVLAIDCSFSVDAAEFQLQMQGLGQALQSEEVFKAILSGPRRRIALLAMQWSDKDNQVVILPWTIIASRDDAVAIGETLGGMGRKLAQGGTSLSMAINFAHDQMEDAPPATRRVIDVSFDGRNNIGPPLKPARAVIVAAGITINGLPIINEFPTLDVYAEQQLIGGQGAFAIKANNYDAYGEAILRKLIREIMGPGIS